MSGTILDAAIVAYNEVWKNAHGTTAANVEEVQRQAMKAALARTTEDLAQATEDFLAKNPNAGGRNVADWIRGRCSLLLLASK